MFTRILAATVALTATLGFTQTVSAKEESAQPATVIIYRAEESVKTSRLKPVIQASNGSTSRLDRDEVLVLEGEPGAFTITTSIADTQPLTLDLKPGATYYVHSELKMRGSRIYSSLVEVEEQVARIQQPEIGAAI